MHSSTRILFFIESLRSGGKERRLVELLSFLKTHTNYSCHVVMMFPQIDYPQFLKLEIPYTVLERKGLKKDPSVFFRFYKVCKSTRPDIIHTWGSMVSFYALPSKLLFRLPFVNSQISDVPLKRSKFSFESFINLFNFWLSDVITANSAAGLRAYGLSSKKTSVIRNGINFNRALAVTNKNEVRLKYGINTKYAVVMVANYSGFKKNQLFVDVANYTVDKRNDVSFISIGGGDMNLFNRVKASIKHPDRVLLAGKTETVEEVVQACDIGVLFTNGEGISNAILEYMLLKKPVIAHAYGGTEELITHNKTGVLLNNDNVSEISGIILQLLDNESERNRLAEAAFQTLQKEFSVEKMGQSFDSVYNQLLD